jgi:hypothetical protein
MTDHCHLSPARCPVPDKCGPTGPCGALVHHTAHLTGRLHYAEETVYGPPKRKPMDLRRIMEQADAGAKELASRIKLDPRLRNVFPTDPNAPAVDGEHVNLHYTESMWGVRPIAPKVQVPAAFSEGLDKLRTQLDDDMPDRYCITTPDGGCVSEDPRCMHNKREPDADVMQCLVQLPDWTPPPDAAAEPEYLDIPAFLRRPVATLRDGDVIEYEGKRLQIKELQRISMPLNPDPPYSYALLCSVVPVVPATKKRYGVPTLHAPKWIHGATRDVLCMNCRHVQHQRVSEDKMEICTNCGNCSWSVLMCERYDDSDFPDKDE